MIEYADIVSIAIDEGTESKYIITLEGKKFSQSIDIEAKATIFSGEADSVLEGLRAAIKQTGRILYIGSVKAIIISEAIAKEGIRDVLDFFIRTNQTRLLTGLYIARGTTASSLLEDTSMYTEFAGYEIDEATRQIELHGGYNNENNLFSIADRLLDPYKNPLATGLELKNLPLDKKTFSIAGVACFKGDRLVGYIEKDYIPLFALWVNRYSNAVLSIQCADYGVTAFYVHKSKTKRSYEYKNGKVYLNLDIKIELSYAENGTSRYGNDEMTKEEINKYIVDYFELNLPALYEYVKTELQTDVLEIEEFFRKYHFSTWKKLEGSYDFLRDTQIETDVEVIIRGAGQIHFEE
jgi:spore germination protein KC